MAQRIFNWIRGSICFFVLAVAATGCQCPRSAPCNCPAPKAKAAVPVPRPSTWLVEDFESPSGHTGGLWYEFDKNPLGTVAKPNPFVLEPGGAPPSPGHSAHIYGTLGSNRAPWSWVQLQISLSRDKHPVDLTAYRTLSFYVKGDGGRYGVALVKDAVKDYDDYRYEFTAPKVWTKISVPLSEFRQAGWGKPVPAVFDDVTRIQFLPVEYDKSFDFFVDQVVLESKEVSLEPIPYDTQGWFPWPGIDPGKLRGTALDVSRLLDAPAGHHGTLGTRGEDLVFRDGTKARFVGVNIVASANFPSHAEAEKMAELLSELGVNITRHHHMDAAWSTPNVFGNGPTTTHLDDAAMERFDYLVAQLQKRGIYQFFDMLVHRKLTPEDGVPHSDLLAAGLKIDGEIDPKLIALQEQFIDQFMGHRNPYTKRTYAQDPAVAMVDVINEDSLFWLQPEGEFSVKTPESRAAFNQEFSKWLLRQVPGGRVALERRWASKQEGRRGLGADEDPSKGTVQAAVSFERGEGDRLSRTRAADTLHFYYDHTLGYYRHIEKHLRKLGYRGLVTGSNHWTDNPLDLATNAQLDFVDRHAYWSHPQGGWGYVTNIRWDPSSMVKDPDLGIVGSLARRRVRGRPYLVSEWQTSAPNDFRAEGLPLMLAYSCLQGWNPIQFAFSHDRDKRVDAPTRLNNNFDIIDQPIVLAVWPAAALMFHRSDVSPSDLDAALQVDQATLYSPDAVLTPPRQLGLIGHSGIAFTGGKSQGELEALRASHLEGDLVRSSTGQLTYDAALGRFQINTPRSQGVVGFFRGQAAVLDNVRIELESPFAVLLVTALTDEPIARARHLLVSAVGNAVNTHMSLDASGNALSDAGTSPILVQPIIGRVTMTGLEGNFENVRAYALDASGQRAHEVPLQRKEGAFMLELSAPHRTLTYEIVRE